MSDAAKLSADVVLLAVGRWRDRPGPAFRALAEAMTAAVETGDLPSGVVLPPERALAAAAGVSRGTVVAAYDLLRAQGVVLRRQGSGTWVRSGLSSAGPDAYEHAAGVRARQLTARLPAPPADIIDLGISVLTEPWGLPETLTIDLPALAQQAAGHGYLPSGLPELRAAIAERYTRAGLPTSPDQISITTGAQHALALCARLLVHPGDVVAIESPTYPGGIDVLARSGARFATVAVDSAGAQPDSLDRVLRAADVQVVSVVPSHAPTGVVMPEARRQRIAEAVGRAGAWLIEDETLADLRFDGEPPPLPLAAHARRDRAITIGSLSKVRWAGLRVGWVRAAPATIARIERLRAAIDLGASVVSQAVALDSLGSLDDDLVPLRSTLATRSAHLQRVMAAALPEWRSVAPATGLSLWCQLPRGSGDAFAATALRHGVAVLPGGAASADELHVDHVRLSFAPPPAVLDAAVERLAAAWSVS